MARKQERVLVHETDPQVGARRIMAERGLGSDHKVRPCRGWACNATGGPIGPHVMIVSDHPGDIGIVIISNRAGSGEGREPVQ